MFVIKKYFFFILYKIQNNIETKKDIIIYNLDFYLNNISFLSSLEIFSKKDEIFTMWIMLTVLDLLPYSLA